MNLGRWFLLEMEICRKLLQGKYKDGRAAKEKLMGGKMRVVMEVRFGDHACFLAERVVHESKGKL